MMDGLEEKKVRAGFASVGRRQIIYFQGTGSSHLNWPVGLGTLQVVMFGIVTWG
jgi:hypothetical protein